ncbi:BACON domain-containing protein [Segatella copri]|uniref:BACON domain-containing protein n=1 Tax=Segatella copri TaxID=165179 RepID=UPI00129126A9|nr:BACON domain-containing protein [Segatella copri]MQN16873.1 BACON domain-containing protein [Segatella copri]MQN17913.1 BACON domain-containing protein [Segatella copri]
MNSKYTKILLALTICLLMSACSDDIFSGTDYFDNGKVTLRLVVPATTVVNTRANTDETISGNDLYVIEYGDQGSCVAMRKVESSNFSDNTLIINNVNTKTTDIHIVANGNAILKGKDNIAKLDGVYCDEIPSPPVLWGHINMSDLKSGTNNTVSLLRNVAMATLNKADSIKDKFVISGWEITQTANQGSIAPKDYTDGSTNELAEDKLDKTIGNCEGSNAGEALYLFETPAKVDSRIVIKANEKYYTANFLDKTGSKLPLLRNHHYQITVTATGKGYDSKEDALNAPAGNIKVDIKDYNFKVTNLISNGAYELGTCDTVRVEAGKKTYSGGEAYFVTMWGNDVNAEKIKPSVTTTPTDTWLTYDSKNDVVTPIYSADYLSAGKGYKLTFTCAKNPSEEIRQTKLTVTFGVLKRDIVIVQKGSNFKKDRDTYIYGLQGDGEKGRDYIKFISKEVNGTSRTAMGGISERDNGLQLGIGRENNYHYTIKKETGDKISQVEGAFEVDDKTNGDYYTIKAKDQNDESVWTGRFTITTQEGYKIIYDIYHTGIFWEEKDTYQPAINRTNTTGWYYYELIESENGVWMLDRNLGATSVDDPGGYYRIKEGKDKTSDMADICPPGFSIPTASLWKQLTPEMTLVTRTTSNGTTYQSVELPAATTAQSKNIRFPRGGMNNGYEVTNPSIGYYWSATIVSGNQGFDFNSPEYGYWYNVARLSSGSKSMISVRYVGGSNLTNTGVYKYLNTRCVKSSSAVLDKNRLTIHDKRKSDKPLYIYIHTENDEYRNRRYGEMIRSKSDGSETTIYYDMIDPDRIMESIGKPLYIRFRQGDDLVDSGWIGEKKLVGNQREFTVE